MKEVKKVKVVLVMVQYPVSDGWPGGVLFPDLPVSCVLLVVMFLASLLCTLLPLHFAELSPYKKQNLAGQASLSLLKNL